MIENVPIADNTSTKAVIIKNIQSKFSIINLKFSRLMETHDMGQRRPWKKTMLILWFFEVKPAAKEITSLFALNIQARITFSFKRGKILKVLLNKLMKKNSLS